MVKKETVICFMKEGFPWVEAYLKKNFDADIIKSEITYNCCEQWLTEVDYIISFLSPWILPRWILDKAKKKAINFHPAPPKYPGSAGYNLAIYNRDEEYGVTCHEMVERVDSGTIYKIKMFFLSGNETIAELRHRSHLALEELFYHVMNDLDFHGIHVYTWESEPHTFKELEELCDCTGITDPEELELRIRACTYPGGKHYPYIKVGDKKMRIGEDNGEDGSVHSLSTWNYSF